MNNYFRITGYCPTNDYCFIMDSNGMFEKLWQFSSLLIQKGLKILEVSSADKFIDINLEKAEQDSEHIILRATAKGQPEYTTYELNNTEYKAIKISNKIYIPNKEQII